MRARLKAFAGHIWPAGRMLCMPAQVDQKRPTICQIFQNYKLRDKTINDGRNC
jgi:hypothetical protein